MVQSLFGRDRISANPILTFHPTGNRMKQLNSNPKHSPMFCFRADWQRSIDFDDRAVPEWFCVQTNWQGYGISTVPWIADVARELGLLPAENTPESWIAYLESLGLREVTVVSCEELFEDRLYS